MPSNVNRLEQKNAVMNEPFSTSVRQGIESVNVGFVKPTLGCYLQNMSHGLMVSIDEGLPFHPQLVNRATA